MDTAGQFVNRMEGIDFNEEDSQDPEMLQMMQKQSETGSRNGTFDIEKVPSHGQSTIQIQSKENSQVEDVAIKINYLKKCYALSQRKVIQLEKHLQNEKNEKEAVLRELKRVEELSKNFAEGFNYVTAAVESTQNHGEHLRFQNDQLIKKLRDAVVQQNRSLADLKNEVKAKDECNTSLKAQFQNDLQNVMVLNKKLESDVEKKKLEHEETLLMLSGEQQKLKQMKLSIDELTNELKKREDMFLEEKNRLIAAFADERQQAQQNLETYKSEIKRILGEKESLQSTFMEQQMEMNNLLSVIQEENQTLRKEKEELFQSLTAVNQDMKNSNEQLATKSKVVAELRDRIGQLEKEKEEFQETAKSLKKDLNMLKEDIIKKDHFVAELEEGHKLLEQEKEQLNATVQLMQTNLAKSAEDIAQKIEIIGQLEEQVIGLRSERDSLSSSNRINEADFERLKTECANRDVEKNAMVEQHLKLQEEFRAAKIEVSKLQDALGNHETQLQVLQEKNAELEKSLSAMESSVTEDEKQKSSTIQELRAKVSELDLACTEKDRTIENLQKEFESTNNSSQVLRMKLEELSFDLGQRELEMKRKEEAIAKYSFEIQTLKQENEFIENRHKEKQEVLKKAYHEATTLQAEKMQKLESRQVELEKEVNEISVKCYTLQNEVSTKTHLLEEQEALVESLKNHIHELESKAKSREKPKSILKSPKAKRFRFGDQQQHDLSVYDFNAYQNMSKEQKKAMLLKQKPDSTNTTDATVISQKSVPEDEEMEFPLTQIDHSKKPLKREFARKFFK